MFKEIFLFELKYRIKRPGTWAYFVILLIFGLFVSIGGNGPASEKVFVNSPVAIANILGTISIFGIMLASAIMGVPIYRDIEHHTQNYYFSFPITEKSYILGRFLGSMTTLFLVSFGLQLGLIVGFALGPFMGFEEPDRFTSFNLWNYIQPTLTIYLTNFFFAGCIFFSLVGLTKKIMLAYAGGAILFITYLVTLTLTQDLENKNIISLIDPFGLETLSNITQYWTPEEQNNQTVPFSGLFIWNRVIWVGFGLILFLYTFFKFNFKSFLDKKLGDSKALSDEDEINSNAVLRKIPKVSKEYSSSLNFKLLITLSLIEFKNILKDNFFIAILIAATLFLFFDAWFGFPIYGTPSLPLTYYMLEVKDFTFVILIFILIVFMTGEVLHRERSVGYDQIFGSLPIKNSVVYGSKFLALIFISFILVNMILVSGVFNQIIKGYFNFEFDKYFLDLYLIEFPKYIAFIMLAFFVHSIVTKKFIGHVITIAIWVLLFGINGLAEVDYNLFLYNYSPGYTVSDLNGFGHFGESIFWFRIYWLAFGSILTLIGFLFWKRGSDSGRKARWSLAKSRINSKLIAAFTICIFIWIGSGAFIYYNVSVLNNYATNDEGTIARADYEKQLSQYDKIAQPKITDVKVYADLVPENRSIKIKGDFIMVNKTNETIDSLHLNWGAKNDFHRKLEMLQVEGKDLVIGKEFEEFGYEIYPLNKPLQPNDTVTMTMKVFGNYQGFPNEGSGSNIVFNGSFLNNDLFPSFGYNSGGELTSDADRKKYELEPKDYSLPEQNDAWGQRNFLFNDDADYITFEGTVSTAPDQIAIMPGYLEKEWEENGRKYYSYKMEGKLDYFFNISSARYNIHKEEWKGKNGETVMIEIFHHPTHTYNIDRFVNGVKKSMDYFTENYGPYQYRQIRILEFPRYSTFAQSFPNTVPFAESFGWVGDFSDPNDLDYVFTVTSHEVAHQWWGHQISPSATRGANQISESMAEYSSLMVMKKEYGVDAMQKFLKEELDRYLRGRANESKFEKTLLDNDTQSYVWYRKGGLILYALQDLVGEENLNSGFKAYTEAARYRPEAPFTTTKEWYSYITKITPDSLKYYIEDSFEKITLYSNKVTNSTYKKLDDGSYETTIEVESTKNYYDGLGKNIGEGTVPNLLEIAVFDEDIINENGMKIKSPLILEKTWVKPGKSTFIFKTKKLPIKAGIDPYNKMIDRIPDDNLNVVEEVE